jgi:mono/diheme cytochrome c family protein
MERQLSGGAQIFNEPQFSVKGSNITPDRETGIGKWSEADFKRAMTQGVRPNGVPLAMVMPFSLFKVLTPRDLDAVWVYVRSIPPVRNEVQHAVYKAEQKSPVYPGADKPMTEEDLRDRVKRGLYLGSIGHCMACHAGRKDDLPDFQNQAGKGGRVFKGPYGTATAANITSHREKGLGAWTDAEIKRALLQSVSRDGRPLAPPMAQYARYYNRLTDADLDAIVAWLRSLPALE